MFVFLVLNMIFQDVQHMDETGSWHSTFQQLNIKAKSNAGSQKVGKSAENRNLNRYRDVVAYDHSLVRLRNSDTEYINANFVKIASIEKQYILTQGPLSHTCKHFWEMIWEQNTYSVVMLNRVVEKNQIKCYQYWPLEGSLTAGDIKVTLMEEQDHNEFIVRVLELEHLKEEEKRNIHHFHYVAWPDFGVPSSPQAFLKFLLAVQKYQSSFQVVGPPVVHCSAGIGRSGTFALIDAALTEIQQKDDMLEYDVKGKLLEMRTYRPGLIQTTEQLHFSYIAILEGANMVAPAAYSAAYYHAMDEDYEEEDEGEDKVEDEGRVEKRRADGERDDGPEAKESKKEPPIPAVPESESESDSADNEQMSLSDVNAQLNENIEGKDDIDEPELGGYAAEYGDKTVVECVDENNDESGGKYVHESGAAGGNDDRKEIKENNGIAQSANVEFPEITITTSSSADRVVDDVVWEKSERTIEQPQQQKKDDDSIIEEPVDNEVAKTSDDDRNYQTQPKNYSEENLESSECCGEQDKQSNNRDDFKSGSNICSGNFSGDFNTRSSEDNVGSRPTSRGVPPVSQSVEKVVNRWHCSENDEGFDGNEPLPKRSAIRRNSLEGNKRKSVTFVNSVLENGDAEHEDSDSHVHEEAGSSHVRRREVEDRKRNLANKVDEIKKKMKTSQASEDKFNSTMLGLALCLAVVGAAYFFYYYR